MREQIPRIVVDDLRHIVGILGARFVELALIRLPIVSRRTNDKPFNAFV